MLHYAPFYSLPPPKTKQITEQIQNLTVSSTTSTTTTSTTNSRSPATDSTLSSSNTNAANSSIASISKETAAANTGKENLAQRLKFLQTQLAHAPMLSVTSKRRQLPSIEEAWNLPISAEMSSRQQQQSAQNSQQRAYARNYNQVLERIQYSLPFDVTPFILFLSAQHIITLHSLKHVLVCQRNLEFCSFDGILDKFETCETIIEMKTFNRTAIQNAMTFSQKCVCLFRTKAHSMACATSVYLYSPPHVWRTVTCQLT